jgi:AcrR family transcriptional regulator
VEVASSDLRETCRLAPPRAAARALALLLRRARRPPAGDAICGTSSRGALRRATRLDPPTGTCFNSRVEERARRIVASAVELAEQGGFEAVRLRDVAAHAGVALGTLYRRFRSKQDLLLAALEIEVFEQEQRMAQRPPQGDTRLERVGAFFQSTTRAICRRPNLARALVRAIAHGEPDLTQKVAAFHTRMERLITAALRGNGRGAADPSEEERRLADILQAVWFSALVGWAGGLHGQAAVVEQTRTAAELMLRGLRD